MSFSPIPHPSLDRRAFMAYFSQLGLASTLLPGVLWSQANAAERPEITVQMIATAGQVAGIEFTGTERETIARGLNRLPDNFAQLRELPITNAVPPAFQFNPIVPGMAFETERRPFPALTGPPRDVPANIEDAAFWTVADLSRAMQARRITSMALTTMYLERLKRFDPILKCVVTLTGDRAMAQAKRADEEIAAGKYRSPLHGIPWGAKDLLAVKGYPTTWGAEPYRDQVIDTDAAVVQRLDEAGAVLVAKLSLGSLAQGDVWFGGRTNSPWNPKQGSSGSSAGPAAATAAGLVGFAIGSETMGSIVSPSTVNGVTGLRPTFGRVSRHGAMALSWTMDKLGPMCRSAEDCALVFNAIYGPDGMDTSVADHPFNWSPDIDIKKLRIGYVKDAMGPEGEDHSHLRRSVETMTKLGVTLVPIELPDFPVNAMQFILTVEAAAAFDDLTRSNRDDLLTEQQSTAWPNTFRRMHFVPAVEYIQANRARTLLMHRMHEATKDIDVYMAPSNHQLLMTNLTGHPQICLPSGFGDQGTPTSVSFVGRLYAEAELIAVARAFQQATDYHLQYPNLKP